MRLLLVRLLADREQPVDRRLRFRLADQPGGLHKRLPLERILGAGE
jgi:hypothetical protein